MMKSKNAALALSLLLAALSGLSQSPELTMQADTCAGINDAGSISPQQKITNPQLHDSTAYIKPVAGKFQTNLVDGNDVITGNLLKNKAGFERKPSLLKLCNANSSPAVDLGLPSPAKETFFNNRRNIYSSLWAFASLNYLYADLVGIMDKNKLLQYQRGVVEGVRITPKFLTVAAGFMQIPLANVFLPQVIKNEKTLRWVQIASGTIMTLVQSGTLFVGKPTTYYTLFSALEIATTAYITIDAVKWKQNLKKRKIASR